MRSPGDTRLAGTVGLLLAVALGAWAESISDSLGQIGLVMTGVIAACIAASAVRRRRRPGRPNFSLVFIASLVLILGIGAGFNDPPIDLERTSAQTWLILAVGVASFSVAAQLAPVGAICPVLPQEARPMLGRRERRFLVIVTLAAVSAAAVNFLTGDIPLLAESTTAARFSGDYGTFGKAWFVIFGCLQAVFVLWIIGRRRSGFRLHDIGILLLIVGVLTLSAGRAFLALSVGAVAIEAIERRRMSLGKVLLVLIGGVLVAGSLGYARTSAEFGEQASNATLRQQHLPSGPLGGTLQSLVIGPRVLSRTLAVVPADANHRHGGFFAADAANVIWPYVERSDRWVTINVMARDVAVNGGQPPTILGGLWIDFGWPGVVLGMAAAAWVTQALFARSRRRPSVARSAEFAFWCAYLMLSLYSYLSLKPQILVAWAVFRGCARIAERERGVDLHQLIVARSRVAEQGQRSSHV